MTPAHSAPVDPATTRLGWIGLGVMGLPMATHALQSGYTLTVANRSPEKAAPLIERGARRVDTPREVADASDVVCLMVGHPHDVEALFRGPGGLFESQKPGLVVIDHTTSSPDLACELAVQAVPLGVTVLDAPVTGGDVGATAGKLSVMVGGTPEAFARVRPLLECYATTVVRQGDPGSGQRAKLVNQVLIASTMIAVCEGLLFANRSRLDPDAVLESVMHGAAGSQALTNLAPRILQGDYRPGFYVEHFVKDLKLALAECDRLNLKLPGLRLAHELYRHLELAGHGRSGTQCLMLALEAMNPTGAG